MVIKKEVDLGQGKILRIETGKLAKQADGAAVVGLEETMVLATAVAKKDDPVPGQDFVPLQVEFREKYSAAGKFPGGFVKREGRPTEKEILSARLIDRALRPLFPDGYTSETQVIVTVISSDKINDGDVLGGVAASVALMISDIPFYTPMAEVRVGRINGNFIINPSTEELEHSDMDICIGGTKDTICMLEGEMKEISEQDMLEAIKFGHEAIKKICAVQEELVREVGKPKREFKPILPPDDMREFVRSVCYDKLYALAHEALSKEARAEKTEQIYDETIKTVLEKYRAELTEEVLAAAPEKAIYLNEKLIKQVIHDLERDAMRRTILTEGKRLDGRGLTDIRPISIELGLIPRSHGSALFTRGETQALVFLTLGTKKDVQLIDTLTEDPEKRFMLHYNFPPFSVGEIGRITGVGRREIGHGNLAERALKNMIPDESVFPYTMRVVSDILESNGSSSMASVCGGTLAIMDGGVPMKRPVAGIAMGLIKEGDQYAILSDILGNEDHLGDMDFKVAGTTEGITACQMDIKIDGLDYDILAKALEQAKVGRLQILKIMSEAIAAPRPELSKYAPRLTTIQIPVEAIGTVIGKGGETIRSITSQTNTEIDIADDGTITIAATDKESAERAIAIIKGLTAEPEEGSVYSGEVKEVRDELGAIVEFLPKITGLLHISEISHKRIRKASEALKAGEKVSVKLIRIQQDPKTGKTKYSLSMKALMPPPENTETHPPRENRPQKRPPYRNGK
ncbi:MAG: polyribonucleotide nucleotidyltransferase [Chloroherpetonaceae bacterium]|nr:polyribonucleotide nucleotidyltransferase [Chloroherpetonaceae bacterium]